MSKAALNGNPDAVPLPKAKVGKYDFSFSGPKTAVLRAAQAMCGQDFSFLQIAGAINRSAVADIAASFQRVACETIVKTPGLPRI